MIAIESTVRSQRKTAAVYIPGAIDDIAHGQHTIERHAGEVIEDALEDFILGMNVADRPNPSKHS